MSRRNLHGINSILIGVLALWLLAGVTRLRISVDTHAGHLLETLDRMGWVAPPSHGDPQLKAWAPFSLNDETAITAAFGFCVYLALASIGSAQPATSLNTSGISKAASTTCSPSAMPA